MCERKKSTVELTPPQVTFKYRMGRVPRKEKEREKAKPSLSGNCRDVKKISFKKAIKGTQDKSTNG